MKKIIILIFLLCLSCNKESVEVEPNYFLNITCYRIVSTTTTTYSHIEYESNPYSRVFWTSPDTVIIDGEKTCIVCCSTYTGADSIGHQLAILPNDYEIRSWTVIGYINSEIADTVLIQ